MFENESSAFQAPPGLAFPQWEATPEEKAKFLGGFACKAMTNSEPDTDSTSEGTPSRDAGDSSDPETFSVKSSAPQELVLEFEEVTKLKKSAAIFVPLFNTPLGEPVEAVAEAAPDPNKQKLSLDSLVVSEALTVEEMKRTPLRSLKQADLFTPVCTNTYDGYDGYTEEMTSSWSMWQGQEQYDENYDQQYDSYDYAYGADYEWDY